MEAKPPYTANSDPQPERGDGRDLRSHLLSAGRQAERLQATRHVSDTVVNIKGVVYYLAQAVRIGPQAVPTVAPGCPSTDCPLGGTNCTSAPRLGEWLQFILRVFAGRSLPTGKGAPRSAIGVVQSASHVPCVRQQLQKLCSRPGQQQELPTTE